MSLLIITIPLISSISIFLFGRYLGQKGVVYISICSIFLSLLISLNLLYGYIKYNKIIYISIFKWVNIGLNIIEFNFIFDKYSLFLTFLISSISFIVICFSTWYLSEDPHKNRFLALLLLFSVSMLFLVSSFNFFILFIGWEGVGILSFLLINFWFNSINSNKSAIKAILYNKIGDIGYLIGLSLLIIIIYNTNLTTLNLLNNNKVIFYILLFFIIASVAKSAQIFLHCWLGDAMAGPTPVSALLHAATMVTAGVFLLFRLESLIYLDKLIQNIIVIIGVFTIIFGGLSSINQFDIKKIIAFSTSSQLGYMYLTNGLLISNGGLFHLLTHGFFKALLFLTAGIIIHNVHNEQDIRKYGAFIFTFPFSFLLFLVGSLSILSFPFLSGFYSKEIIILTSFHETFPIHVFILMTIGALFTSIYSFKLLNLTFFKFSNGQTFKVHNEIPLNYLPILLLLVIGSIFFGYFFKDVFISFFFAEFNSNLIKLFPLLISLLAILISFIELNPWKNRILLRVLNKRLYIDSLNNYLAYLTLKIGHNLTFKSIDRGILEFIGPVGLIRILYSIPFYNSKKSNIFKTGGESNLILYLLLTFLAFIVLFYINI